MSDILHLCATSRLAQTLRTAIPAGATVWRTPWALTVSQWLAGLADEALLSGIDDLPQMLDPFAERVLWETVITASLTEAAPLFDIQGMAASAAEAHALSQVWRLSPDPASLVDEAALFAGWQAAFEEACRRQGWRDPAGLNGRLVGLIEAGHFGLPPGVRLIGFDRLTPLEDRLIAALRQRGVAVEIEGELEDAVPAAARQVLSFPDSAAECAAVAEWARRHLAADPGCRLGIVAPDLAAVRDALAFQLEDALQPSLIRSDAAEVPRCFNISLGRSLAEMPLVRVALELLALGSARSKVEQQRLSALLLAVGWGAAEAEADGRARLDAAVRRDLPYFTSLSAVRRLAARLDERGPTLCPLSMTALGGLLDTLADAPRNARASEWAALFRRGLQAAGWPGDRELSSHEYQAWRALGEELDGFGRLDALLGRLTLSEAVRRFAQGCRQRVFQPETRGTPAIQVLGVLESAGLHFDALWVMGMNDDRWPPPPRPNPLLPAEAQRAAGSAHASADVELDFAQRVHRRLLAAAPSVVFSWAQADGNRVLRPSPLLAGMPSRPGEAVPPAGLAGPLAAECALAGEQLMDAVAPPVGDGEKVPGGSWLLRAQAICPAWAYFQYRLGGEAMEVAVEGLDPAARGTLVHGALEVFWRSVRSSAALLGLSEAGRQDAIAAAVEQALAAYEQKERLSLPVRFRQLEAARLQRLLAVWLAIEQARPQSFEVVACEAPAEVAIEGLRVRMVVDRIDRLADGRQVIIDYKTGAAIDYKNWAAARITEPQLPIYAALVNDAVAAVVFAKVLLDKPAFAGIADEGELLPGVLGVGEAAQKIFDPVEFPDWPSVVAHWQARLHAIAGEVRAGVAGVAFADEKALQYCEVLPLLRLPERRRLLAETLAAGDAR